MNGKRPSGRDETASTPKRPRKFFVKISRETEVEKARQELPVYMHEQEIIEAIHEHDVILITGATGTGKTTQVPQFLIEDGFGHPSSPSSSGLIAVTQPRRVAATTCAKRVAHELNSPLGKPGGLIGYQVRHDSRITDDIRVKFSTDGILLREVEHDISLKRYSAIIIDEAHERSLNTDLLLSFLSRSVLLRRAKKNQLGLLKVIIMSATLDVDGILSGKSPLFPNPPVIKVPSRQFPITIHFSKITLEDYVEEAFRKVSQIHTRLPPGGILVFLSGREEVERLCTKLRTEFSNRKVKVNLSTSAATTSSSKDNNKTSEHVDEAKENAKEEGSSSFKKEKVESSTEQPSPPHSSIIEVGIQILPFYSLLPDHLQRRVFQKSQGETDNEGSVKTLTTTRKVVIATNIAETSVTVPDITYVVDSGRAKEKVYKGQGLGRLSAYEVCWISQASAEQRAGRAGRTSAGHCYRLYSSAVYDQQFVEFRKPEILRMPTDSVVLRLRAMGIRHVAQFPFATPPPLDEIIAAENLLTNLGALSSSSSSNKSTKSGVILGVTPIGRMIASLPLEPRLGRLLLAARVDGKVNTIGLACRLGGVLSVGTMFQHCTDKNIWNIQTKLRNTQSDLLTELAAVCAVEHAGKSNKAMSTSKTIDTKAMRTMCERFALHTKCVLEAIAVAKQVERTIGHSESADLRPPDGKTVQRLLRAVVAGFGDRIARRLSRDEAAAAGVIPKLMSRAFIAPGIDRPVFIEGGSSVRVERDTDFVCFSELVEIEVKRKSDIDEQDRDDYDENESDDDQIIEEENQNGNRGDSKIQIIGKKEDDNIHGENEKLNKKKGLAKKDGGKRNVETRIVMRGVSIIEPRWVIEEAEGICDMKVMREIEPEYDSEKQSVTEMMMVSYKGKGWVLGRKRLKVEDIEKKWDPESINEEKRNHYVKIFSKALLNGRVEAEMNLSKEEGRVEACHGRLTEILQTWTVFTVDTFRKCISLCTKEILEVVDVCCYPKHRVNVLKRWRKGIKHFTKLDNMETKTKNDEDLQGFGGEESSSDDDY